MTAEVKDQMPRPIDTTAWSEDKLRAVLAETGEGYQRLAATLDTDESPEAVYGRIVFAMLTVNSPIDASLAAYKQVMLAGAQAPNLAEIIGTQWRGVGSPVMYANQKAKYIREFDERWGRNPYLFTCAYDDDDMWRTRLAHSIRGLGIAKASFAVALVKPSEADVCCIDTHMFQILQGSGFYRKESEYRRLESKVRQLAGEFGLSTFAAQWCLWDAKRGEVNEHRELRS